MILNIQWYPGHMAKTRKLLTENLKLVDVVIELLDARIPKSSKNPEIDKIVKDKKRIMVLNKSDLADDEITELWVNWYRDNGINCIPVNSVTGAGLKEIRDMVRELMAEKVERAQSKGLRVRSVRLMVVGIPNVGKSTFINKLAGKSSAKTGNKPGVTRGKQWIRLGKDMDLLDTPGILWPKFEDKTTGMNLAFTGAIKDEIVDIAELAAMLLAVLAESYPGKITERYKLENIGRFTGHELLETAAIKRGCLVSGGEPDLYRIASIVLDEFRTGKIGKITLERPV